MSKKASAMVLIVSIKEEDKSSLKTQLTYSSCWLWLHIFMFCWPYILV